jgi:hypothetical protein
MEFWAIDSRPTSIQQSPWLGRVGRKPIGGYYNVGKIQSRWKELVTISRLSKGIKRPMSDFPSFFYEGPNPSTRFFHCRHPQVVSSFLDSRYAVIGAKHSRVSAQILANSASKDTAVD